MVNRTHKKSPTQKHLIKVDAVGIQSFIKSKMTYYLGKVGRAGARLVSSCKDLYNDVNAAYLTGATDVVVVKQKDGSLKSTPFHVRFGKLGVLRTGDLKEVEISMIIIIVYTTLTQN